MFTDCQSGFILGNSCISKLLSVTQEIHKSFDCNPPQDVRGVFLDISKAFDKVRHEGPIFKSNTYDAEGKLIMLMENYLKNRKQRVVLNGLISYLQGFHSDQCWDHFSFSYVNDLPHDISSACKMFADGTLLFSKKYLSLILTMTWKQ